VWDRLTAALDQAGKTGALPVPERKALMREGVLLTFPEAMAISRTLCETSS
jgi:hypothetical protein